VEAEAIPHRIAGEAVAIEAIAVEAVAIVVVEVEAEVATSPQRQQLPRHINLLF